MQTITTVPEAIELIIRLRRGTAIRRVTVTIGVHAEHWSPLAVARVIGIFTDAVEAGLFGAHNGPVHAESVRERGEGGWSLVVWEATFPKMPPEAFGVLARMVAAGVPGARRFEVAEHAPEAALVVRSFDGDTEATIADVAFRITFTEAAAPRVRLVFHDRVPEGILDRAKALFGTWTAVVSGGGFRGPHGEASSNGALVHVQRVSARELVATFDHLSAAHEAIEALFQALVRLDDLAPVELVEVASARGLG